MDKGFADIHCHILPGVDDGARSIEEMQKMLDIAYEDGIRIICFTPHIRRPWLDLKPSDILESYVQAKRYAELLSSDIKLCIGGELLYSYEVVDEHPEKIRTMNETDVVLVEFMPDVSYKEMIRDLSNLQQDGYICMLAHIERYEVLRSDIKAVEHLYRMGIILQVNASSITRPRDHKHKKFVHKVLKNQLVHVISTDAHRCDHRRPRMKEAYKIVSKKYGQEYADDIFRNNAIAILNGKDL